MIVGATQSGKTVSWKVLQAAMTKLNKEGDPNYLLVRVSILSHGLYAKGKNYIIFCRLSPYNVFLREIEFVRDLYVNDVFRLREHSINWIKVSGNNRKEEPFILSDIVSLFTAGRGQI